MSGKRYRWRHIDQTPALISMRQTCNVCRKELFLGKPHEECIAKGIAQFQAEQRAAFAKLRQSS